MPDKAVELKFGSDDSGFQKIRRMIGDITRDVDKLVETAKRASQALAGIGGAPMAMGVTAGASSVQHAASSKAGLGGVLTQGISANANLVKSMAQATATAYRQISDSTHTSVDMQVREIQRLRRELQGLMSEQHRMMGDAYAPGGNRNRQFTVHEQLDRAQANLAALRGRAAGLGGIDLVSGPMASTDWNDPNAIGHIPAAAKRQGLFARANQALRDLPSGEGRSGLVNTIAGQLGISGLAKANPVMAIGAAFMAGAKMGTGMAGAYAGEQIKQSFDPFRRLEMQGSVMGGAALRLRSGDMSMLAAMRRIRTDSVLRSKIHDDLETEFSAQGIAGAGLTSMAIGALSGEGSAQRAMQDAPILAKKAFFDKLQMVANSQPVENAILAQFDASAASRAGTMRALGFNPFRVNPKTGRSLEGSLIGRGLSPGDLAGPQGALEQMVGLAAAQHYGMTAMNFGIGHFRGAEGVLASGILAGSAAPVDLLRAVRGSAGDVGVASRLGQTFAAQMMNGATPTNGFGLLGAMSSIPGAGVPGGAMRAQNQVGAGIGAAEALFQGGPDPYQRGRNLLAAIRALGPSGSIFGQEYLAGRTSFRQIADVMGGGDVTPEMRARGITAGAVNQYGSEVVRSLLDRFVSNGDHSPQSEFARQILQRGGNVNEVMRGRSAAQRERGAMLLGTILEDTGVVQGDEAAQGAARLILGLGASSAKGKRRGAGDAAAGSLEVTTALKHAGEVQDDFNKRIQDGAQGIKEMYEGSIKYASFLEQTAGSLSAGLGRLVDSTEAAAVALDRLAESADPSGKTRQRDIVRYAQMPAAVWKATSKNLDVGTIKDVEDFRRQHAAIHAAQRGATDGPEYRSRPYNPMTSPSNKF